MASLPAWPRTMRKAKAAAYVDCAVPKFERLVAEGIMPAPFDLCGVPAWDQRDLDESVDNVKAGARVGRWQDKAPARA